MHCDMPATFILIENGAPHIVDALPELKPDRLAVMARFWEREHAFDNQSEYSPNVTNVPSFGWLSKTLAHTVYNPSVNIDCDWTVCGNYDPKRIVKLVNDGLKHDDDLIQQGGERTDFR